MRLAEEDGSRWRRKEKDNYVVGVWGARARRRGVL